MVESRHFSYFCMPLSRGNALLRSLELSSLLRAFVLHYLSEDNALKFTCLVNFNLCLGVTFLLELWIQADMLECGLIWVVLLIAAFQSFREAFSKVVSFAQISGADIVYLKYWSPASPPDFLALTQDAFWEW